VCDAQKECSNSPSVLFQRQNYMEFYQEVKYGSEARHMNNLKARRSG
jgi:hypothetical protein